MCEYAIHIFDLGSWYSIVGGKQSLCHPFPYTDALSIGFARINIVTALGLLPRCGSAQKWCPGCMGLAEEKQSSEGKNPLLMGYRMKNYTIQFFFF